jgi:hypothetical protein
MDARWKSSSGLDPTAELNDHENSAITANSGIAMRAARRTEGER